MAEFLFHQANVKKELVSFFRKERAEINDFGNTVNQTFEAKVFADVVKWYQSRAWVVTIVNPIKNGRPIFKLKFNTRGAPLNYSYAICAKQGQKCQIRHGLRVHTKSYKATNRKSANVVCDIVVMKDIDIDHFDTNMALDNSYLLAFGEVKHMSAFAELVASFIGLVYELDPSRLRRIRTRAWKKPTNISSFLYVSGILYKTAEGLLETIKRRKFDIDIYSFNEPMI